MNKKSRSALLAILLPLLYACSGDHGLVVTPALAIKIQDVRTGGPVYEVMVIARDGAYADTSWVAKDEHSEWSGAFLAENRAGTYDLTITHPAYHTWHREGIRVTWSSERNPFSNSRMPKQVHILAELQPLASP